MLLITKPIMAENNPVRLAILDLEGKVFGYKTDSGWSLSLNPKKYKEHSLESAGPRGHLAANLRYGFNQSVKGTVSTERSWFNKFKEGVIVSVQDISPENFGKELMRYRLVRRGDKYRITTA